MVHSSSYQTSRSSVSGWRGNWPDWAVIAVILIIGTVIAATIFKINRDLDTARVQVQLEKRAEWRADDLSHKIRLAVAPIEALASYISVQRTLNPNDLNSFSATLLGGDGVRPLLLWAPLVMGDQRDAFVKDSRQGWSATYDLNQRAPDGTITVVSERDQYLPVLFEDHIGSEQSVLGFDELSDTFRKLRIERARDQGQPIATPPVDIAIGPRTSVGYFVYWPVTNMAHIRRLSKHAGRRSAAWSSGASCLMMR